jgi:hypothetical protein
MTQTKCQLVDDAASRHIQQSQRYKPLTAEANVVKNTRTDSGLAFADDVLLSPS